MTFQMFILFDDWMELFILVGIKTIESSNVISFWFLGPWTNLVRGIFHIIDTVVSRVLLDFHEQRDCSSPSFFTSHLLILCSISTSSFS